MSDLHVVSTDEHWKPAITKEDITKIFKIVTLDGLAVYWNCNSACYDHIPKVDLLHKMRTEIASKGKKPENYKYGEIFVICYFYKRVCMLIMGVN